MTPDQELAALRARVKELEAENSRIVDAINKSESVAERGNLVGELQALRAANAERLRAVNAERERDELRARCASLISSNTTLRRERNEARAALESEKTTRNEIIAKGEILERLNAELESERGHLLSLVKDWNANFANAVKENEELRFLNQGWRRKIDKLCDEIDALRVANAELVAALRKLVKVGSDAYRAHLRSSTTMHAQLVFLSEVCDDAEEVLAREEAQA